MEARRWVPDAFDFSNDPGRWTLAEARIGPLEPDAFDFSNDPGRDLCLLPAMTRRCSGGHQRAARLDL